MGIHQELEAKESRFLVSEERTVRPSVISVLTIRLWWQQTICNVKIRLGTTVKRTCYSCRRLKFRSHHPY